MALDNMKILRSALALFLNFLVLINWNLFLSTLVITAFFLKILFSVFGLFCVEADGRILLQPYMKKYDYHIIRMRWDLNLLMLFDLSKQDSSITLGFGYVLSVVGKLEFFPHVWCFKLYSAPRNFISIYLLSVNYVVIYDNFFFITMMWFMIIPLNAACSLSFSLFLSFSITGVCICFHLHRV